MSGNLNAKNAGSSAVSSMIIGRGEVPVKATEHSPDGVIVSRMLPPAFLVVLGEHSSPLERHLSHFCGQFLSEGMHFGGSLLTFA